MNDRLLAWIRIAVVSTIGASVAAFAGQWIAEPMLSQFVNAIQLVITIGVYVGLTTLAEKFPIINQILSLFMSKNGPKYVK